MPVTVESTSRGKVYIVHCYKRKCEFKLAIGCDLGVNSPHH